MSNTLPIAPTLTITWEQELQDVSKSSDRMIFSDDPVALGLAAYRLWKTQAVTRFCDFDQLTVENEDRQIAEHLRSYYKERTQNILFDVLQKGQNGTSEFRKKLALIAVNQYKDYVNQDLGLFYRLPYFYHEDLALDLVIANSTVVDPTFYSQAINQTQQLCLTPMQRVFRSRSAGESVMFWFLNQAHSGIYQITVLCSNPLLSLFDSMFQQSKLTVTAKVNPARLRGQKLVYGKLSNIMLA
jgi:hypothetical protein